MQKQPGFFDLKNRHEKLLNLRSFLEKIKVYVDWESFRSLLNAELNRNTPSEQGGRPAYDVVFMFKVIVLQALYNLSDEQTEYQILDRLSFMRFLDLDLHDAVPDSKTIWLFRDTLRKAELVEKLFARFDEMLSKEGFAANGGQIIDATFVSVPIQRNTTDENDQIKQGETHAGWSEKKRSRKDTDARWTKKNETSYFGYKNHINIDNKYKIIRRYTITAANVHDGQEMDAVLDLKRQDKNVWADSAYRSEEQESRLKKAELNSYIHERAYRNRPLTIQQKKSNTEKSKTRARVEHVFGYMENSMNGCFVRTIGLARAKVKIGLENLGYNIARFTMLMAIKDKITPV